MNNIARVSTVPFFIVTQLRDQIDFLARSNFSVSVICSAGEDVEVIYKDSKINYFPIEIVRNISPFKDLCAIVKLIRFFIRNKIKIVHSTTPKAGLLCAIAAYVAGVPIRLHTYTGQVWVTKTGGVKLLAKLADKLIARLNILCYADSKSQALFLVESGVVDEKKIKVLGQGSLAGVDLVKFNSNNFSVSNKVDLKKTLAIPEAAKIILFVGRLSRDKGIYDLLAAFQLLKKQMTHDDCYLLLVGPTEIDPAELNNVVAEKEILDAIRLVGYSNEPEMYMSISNLLCLPSYREGFGTVVIEAAAMGLPTVGSRIYGLSDAIVDGVTGLLVEPKDIKSLSDALSLLIENDALRLEMGGSARQHAEMYYDKGHVNKLVLDEYERLMAL